MPVFRLLCLHKTGKKQGENYMKLHLKLTSVLLSAVMCASMVMAPVSVIADETTAPSETQTAETTEKEQPKETKQSPKETEKKESAVGGGDPLVIQNNVNGEGILVDGRTGFAADPDNVDPEVKETQQAILDSLDNKK